MDASERISAILKHYGISVNDFAKRLGLERPQAIYDILNGKTKSITEGMASKIISVFSDISKSWILSGEGRMIPGPYGRINEILRVEGITQREFAKGTGGIAFFIPSIYDRAQANPGDPVVLKQWVDAVLNRYPQYSREWIMTGQGEMINTPSQRKKIPLYDTETVGGHNELVADTERPAGHVAEWIDAGDWFPGATAAIRHYGDSMVEYPSGSILALKRVEDQRLLINGQNYVIETSEYRITKKIQDDGGDYIMAYSSNRETYPDGQQIHSPIKIPKSEIRHIDLVLGCVIKEYSNGPVQIIKK